LETLETNNSLLHTSFKLGNWTIKNSGCNAV